jgi:ketosteroid isomerase-like protein
MNRQDYIDLVETVYFGCMTRGELAPILALFAEDAVITTFHGDTPARRMRAAPGPGEEPLAAFFSRAIDNFNVRYTDFDHVVDVTAQRIAAVYTLHISPKPDGPLKDVAPRQLRNCNVFQLRDGRITAVTAYFAHPPTIPPSGFQALIAEERAA